jgi:hypothetical protein
VLVPEFWCCFALAVGFEGAVAIAMEVIWQNGAVNAECISPQLGILQSIGFCYAWWDKPEKARHDI